MVHLKGLRMSGRRGLYYTIDEMLVDAELSILKKLIEREEKRELRDLLEIAEKLAIANTRAILVSVDPGKVLVFDPGKISEVEYGVMIQYAFVRAQGVVRNLWGLEFLDSREEVIGKTIEYTRGFEGVDLTSEEKKLVDDVLRYPLVLKTAYIEKSPSKILEYALNLAIDFNKFYEKYPVISEKNENTRKARVLITVLTLLTLSELIDILGFPKLRRM
jgi:arginyl-tRNA synthetase